MLMSFRTYPKCLILGDKESNDRIEKIQSQDEHIQFLKKILDKEPYFNTIRSFMESSRKQTLWSREKQKNSLAENIIKIYVRR